MSFLLKRLGFYMVALWAAVTLNFVIPRFMPGDPATLLLSRISDRLTPDQIEGIRKIFGLTDEPIPVQYVRYVGSLLHGDLGISISRFPTPVSDVIGSAVGWTLLLGVTALICSFLIGSLLGIAAAWRRGGNLDGRVLPGLMFLAGFPYFWIAMIALFVIAFVLGWLPLGGAYTTGTNPAWTWSFISDVAVHLVLPLTTILAVSIGGWMLGIRNAMVGTTSEDFVFVAIAKGLSERRVKYRYAARNAVLPSLTSFGMALGFIVSGALFTEMIFSYPGLGFILLNAVSTLDYPLVQGLLLIVSVGVILANFIVDLLYVRLDPRVRTR